MTRTFRALVPAVSLVGTVLVACAQRVENAPLAMHDPLRGYRPRAVAPNARRSRELFVCLTLSGGGTRAAALGFGVLRALRDTVIPAPDGVIPAPDDTGTTSLLDEVDVISSVSGGSFPAAYYALFGDRIFDEFPERVLHRDFEGELAWHLLPPWRCVRLASGAYSRIDAAARIYHETIFDHATFAELEAHPERPFVLINATDMSSGQQFSFTQDEFDLLGSDLSSYPVASAVAASSAFPVLLTPVTLTNHPAPTSYELPQWMTNRLASSTDRPLRVAFEALTAYHRQKEEHRYLHLIDGGLADNLGIDAVVQQYGHLLEHGRTRRILFIVVNARNAPHEDIGARSGAPGLVEMIYKSGTVSMDRYSYATIDRLRTQLDEVGRAQRTYAMLDEEFQALAEDVPEELRAPLAEAVARRAATRPRLRPRETYLVEVSLDGLEHPETRRRLLGLPTTFALAPDDVDALVAAGASLLEADPEFRRFLAECDAPR